MVRMSRISPRLVNWVADHPASPLGWLAAQRFGRPPRDWASRVLSPSDSPLNVLIAPANYAGQASSWAAALRQADPEVDAKSFAVDQGGFQFPADLWVPPAVFHNSARWQRRQLDEARRFSHVLIESLQPPFGRLLGRDLDRQVDAIGAEKVALMCHGTDVRLPSANRMRTPWSPYADSPAAARQEELAARNLDFIARHPELPVFVSTPDLLADVPRAVWCPVSIDIGMWTDPGPRHQRPNVPVVVHAPSKPGVKGTEHIDPVLSRLDREDVIEYRPVRGVRHAEIPGIFKDADIVVDQIGLGSYGVAACEAMASACVVVSHVTEEVRAAVHASTGMALPIVEADPKTLEDVLRRLAADDDRRRRIAARSREFAAVHDGRESARRLLAHWIRTSTDPASRRHPASDRLEQNGTEP